jgi:uncharacterized integral membrane protein
MQKVKMILGAVLAVLVIIVVLQNTEEVETDLLFFTIKMPRAALLAGTAVIGFALGVITAGRLVKKSKVD